MATSISFDSVTLAMLQELAKKSRMKTDQYLASLIQEQYKKNK